MVIGGKEIKRHQDFKNLDDYYFQALKSIARDSLSELTFLNIENHNLSKSSDSIYFNFTLNHHEDVFTLSLRTHRPKEYLKNYFYFYLYNYDNLRQLRKAIQKEIVSFYNKKAGKLGISKSISDYKRKPHNHQASLKKKKKNRTKLYSFNAHDSLNRFMREVNHKTQKQKHLLK